MIAADVMTKDIVSISPNASIHDMARLMVDKRVSGLPVVDGAGKLVGIVTEGDCLRRAELKTDKIRSRWIELLTSPTRLSQEYVRSHGQKVSEIMSTSLVTVREDTSLTRIVELMETRHIKRVLVVREDKLVGVVSRSNLVEALIDAGAGTEVQTHDDRAIHGQLLAAIAKVPAAGQNVTKIAVQDGIVDLWGSYFTTGQDEALIVAAENVIGVKVVRSHLVWIEPFSGYIINDPDGQSASAKSAL